MRIFCVGRVLAVNNLPALAAAAAASFSAFAASAAALRYGQADYARRLPPALKLSVHTKQQCPVLFINYIYIGSSGLCSPLPLALKLSVNTKQPCPVYV